MATPRALIHHGTGAAAGTDRTAVPGMAGNGTHAGTDQDEVLVSAGGGVISVGDRKRCRIGRKGGDLLVLSVAGSGAEIPRNASERLGLGTISGTNVGVGRTGYRAGDVPVRRHGFRPRRAEGRIFARLSSLC
jgi:hypothetical protein